MLHVNNLSDNLFLQKNRKYQERNNLQKNSNKNFIHGLKNARNILKGLEKSIRKNSKYEKDLMTCKSSHSHCHDTNEWWSDRLSSKCSKTELSNKSSKTSRRTVDLAESWSTMSIICLQYQLEELSKRYESLLQEYDKRCSLLQTREVALARLGQRARVARARLTHAHKTLLAVGEKYLVLRSKRIAQKAHYESRIQELKRTVNDVMEASEHARKELNCQISSSMISEPDSGTSLLLAEIRKCNLLYLENLRLKAQIEELAPGQVNWEIFY